jgi:hypothetical protein
MVRRFVVHIHAVNKMLDFLIQQTYRPMYTEERPVQSRVRGVRILKELSTALEGLFPMS